MSFVDPDDEDQRILFLFFIQRKQVYMLLGREEIVQEQEKEEDKEEPEIEIDQVSKTSSQMAC